MKHTKGEWKVEPDLSYKGTYILKANGNFPEYKEDFANAKLIASAPNLLKACIEALVDTEMLLNEECECNEDNLKATIENLKQAILKAIDQRELNKEIKLIKSCI